MTVLGLAGHLVLPSSEKLVHAARRVFEVNSRELGDVLSGKLAFFDGHGGADFLFHFKLRLLLVLKLPLVKDLPSLKVVLEVVVLLNQVFEILSAEVG